VYSSNLYKRWSQAVTDTQIIRHHSVYPDAKINIAGEDRDEDHRKRAMRGAAATRNQISR